MNARAHHCWVLSNELGEVINALGNSSRHAWDNAIWLLREARPGSPSYVKIKADMRSAGWKAVAVSFVVPLAGTRHG